MLPVLLALAPIFLLILAGHLARRRRWVDDGFWGPSDRLVYFIFFPALLVNTTARADIGQFDLAPMVGAMVGALACVHLTLLLLRRFLPADGPAFTSVVQGAVRFNTYVGLAAAKGLYGLEGMSLFAVSAACTVPLTNIACVLTLAKHGNSGLPFSWQSVGMQILKNPLIAGCVIGLALNLAGGMPPVVGPLLEILAAASLPLGLLSVGAGLDWRVARQGGPMVMLSSALKLLALPLLIFLFCRGLEIDPVATNVAVLFGLMPTATSAYLLAKQMGGDAPLMAAITTFQTLLAFATIPIVLLILAAF